MKNKFNIGDKVMVRGDLEIGEWYGGLVFLPLMVEHRGTISEIINVEFRSNYSCCYFLKDMYSPVGYPWYWSEEMLENPVVHLCNVEVKKASKDSAMGSLKISKVGESHEWAEKPGSYPWGCKFKKGDSVKVTKQFTDVKTGYYQVLDAICINEKSWYTLKGAPMIWVPEENLEINDHDSVKETFKKVKEEPLKKNALITVKEFLSLFYFIPYVVKFYECGSLLNGATITEVSDWNVDYVRGIYYKVCEPSIGDNDFAYVKPRKFDVILELEVIRPD